MDDIVELSAGGQIPADAVVLEGQLNVNESLLTGEADEIVKKMAMNCCPAALWCPAAVWHD